ncbi:MAG: nuclear transport factor 2 family protein [Rhizomicrobium sp.]
MGRTSTDQTFSTAEELAHEFLRAIQAKDKEAILSILEDGFVLEVPYNISGTNDLSDSWHGLEAAAANFDKTWKNIEVVRYADFEITAGKDANVAFAEALGDMKMANGRPYRNRYVFRFDTDGGKIKRIREYANPVTSVIAFGIPWPQSAAP